jgi:hypothetical protein
LGNLRKRKSLRACRREFLQLNRAHFHPWRGGRKVIADFAQNALISYSGGEGHLAWLMMPSATFRGPAAQCFVGIIALTLVTSVCLRLKADMATTAFIYLAVIVLLSLIGSYVVSMIFTILSDAAAIRRREMAPKPGLAAAANSSTMAPEPIGEWAVSWRKV